MQCLIFQLLFQFFDLQLANNSINYKKKVGFVLPFNKLGTVIPENMMLQYRNELQLLDRGQILNKS